MTVDLVPVMRGTTHVLLDFDGPVCSIFSGISALEVADELRARMEATGNVIAPDWRGEADPLALLRRIGEEQPGMTAEADAVLTELETAAAGQARLNPDVKPLLDACATTGRAVMIVSNNAGRAIGSYLRREGLAGQVGRVVGRVPGDPVSMKPAPRLLLDAMGETAAASCVFIGDAVRDVEAGHAAGVPTIGYANKPGKAEKLSAAGAVVVVESLLAIADAIHAADAS